MPTLFFADLVRELCREGGTGPLTPSGAVPGHRRFADAVPAETSFHYAIAGVAQPGQWETGTGRIDGDGRLQRDSVATSSNGGARVDFAPGLKTIALTVGAGWFAASDAAAADLGGALAGKQPLSTGHGSVASGDGGDLVTVRRGAGWVNIPLSALAFRNAGGTMTVGAPLAAPAGSAAAPALCFAADPGTGLFRAASDSVGLATAGTERLRVAADGSVGIGLTTPSYPLHVRAATPALCLESQTTTGTTIGVKGPRLLLLSNSFTAGNGGEIVFGINDGDAGRWGAISGHVLSNASGGSRGNIVIATKGASGDTELAPRLVVEAVGIVRPGADNGQTLGAPTCRWSVIHAATGAINTSDARDKIWHGPASTAEFRAARRIAAELGFYQWIDSVAAKGANGARRHFGVRAQAIWAIMADEGLVDPLDAAGRPGATPYAFLCWDEWGAEGMAGDPGDGEAAQPVGDRFGIREGQLALFLAAAQEARLAALEAAA